MSSSDEDEDPKNHPEERSNISFSVDDDTLRILLSTDNHLGYAEKDPVRGMDSFAAFEEVLYLAKRYHCDMVLIAGDLFHDNRPSRRTLHKTMEIIRRYSMGQDAVRIQILSDPAKTFRGGTVNYLDENYSVDLPIFSIHGNHDDPTRDVGGETLAALDLLSVTNLVNYFGRQDLVDKVEVPPVLVKKGSTKVALYGLGSMRDERLNRMWSQGKVRFLRPEEDNDEFFNIFALHQNRDLGRGSKNCVKEDMVPEWMDIVVWGHEHECQIEFQESVTGTFRISQPGSSVATSLVAGEAVRKKVGILDILQKDGENHFRLSPIPLTQVRGFVTTELSLKDHRARLDPDDAKVDAKVTEILEEEVRLLILNAREKVQEVLQEARRVGSNAGDEDSPLKYKLLKPNEVLVRVRVDHSGFSSLNNQRFGSRFVGDVANPADILLFSRRKEVKASDRLSKKSAALQNAIPPEEQEGTKMEDLVMGQLEGPDRKLQLLDKVELSEALEEYVDKNTLAAIPDATIKMVRKKQKDLIARGVDDGDETIEKGAQIRELLDAEAQAQEDRRSREKKKSRSIQADESVDNEQQSTSGKENTPDDDRVVPARRPADRSKYSRAAEHPTRKASRQQRLDDSDEDMDLEEVMPAPKARAKVAASRPKRAQPTKRPKYYEDDDDDDDGAYQSRRGNSFEDDELDDDDEEEEEAPRKRAKKTSAATNSRTRKASTAKKPAAPRTRTTSGTSRIKKSPARKTAATQMDSDDEDSSHPRNGRQALDDDWGTAATRSQL